MNQQNLVVIEGNAVRDADIKTTATGAMICKMSIANNRFYKSGDGYEKEVSYFDVDCFGEVARLCADKVKRGSEVRVTGRLKQSRWQQDDGQNRNAVVIVASLVEFGSKAREQGGNPDPAEGDVDF